MEHWFVDRTAEVDVLLLALDSFLRTAWSGTVSRFSFAMLDRHCEDYGALSLVTPGFINFWLDFELLRLLITLDFEPCLS